VTEVRSPSAARRATHQGAAVKDALVAQDGFRSAQDVYAVLRAEGHKIGLSTVYRHLQAFTERGLADAIHNPDGETTYRYCGDTAAGRHHHHLVCRSCGRAEEVEGRAVERWADQTADRYGYTDVDHTVEIFGTCRDCADTGSRG
jgi:Fur family ferric uptake transcriptional regulator